MAKRMALIVGNSEYENVYSLNNASKDAQDMAAALQKLDFSVTLLTDTGEAEFWSQLDSFATEAEEAETTLFFFSGHAFQMDGANYLVPSDASLTSKEAIQNQTWRLDSIVEKLQDRNRSTLIFLDACRNNPLPESQRQGSGEGLAKLETGTGTFVAFATQPGNVTSDGLGDNSPFSESLLEHIATPGLSISDLMIKVRNDTEAATYGNQIPWDQSSLRTQVYFNPVEEKKPELTEADLEMIAQLDPETARKLLNALGAAGVNVGFTIEAVELEPEEPPVVQASFTPADAPIETDNAPAFVIEDAPLDGAPIEDDEVYGDPISMIDNRRVATSIRPSANPLYVPAPAEEPVVAQAATPDASEAEAIETPEVVAGAETATPEAVDPLPEAETLSAQAGDTATGAKVSEAEAGQVVAGTEAAATSAAGTARVAGAEAVQSSGTETVTGTTVAPTTVTGSEVEGIMAQLPTPPETPGSAAFGEEIEAITLAALAQTRSLEPILLPRARVEGAEIDAAEAEELGLSVQIEELQGRELAFAVQTELARLGCYRARIDGAWGKLSAVALTRYYIARQTAPESLDPTNTLYQILRTEGGVVCEGVVAPPKSTQVASAQVRTKIVKQEQKVVKQKQRLKGVASTTSASGQTERKAIKRINSGVFR